MWKRLLSVAALSSFISISLALTINFLSESTPGSMSKGFQVCEGHDNSTFKLEKLEISPQPVKPGSTLKIYAKGVLHKQIQDGSVLHVNARYIGIQILDRDMDFCREAVGQVGRECPVEEGRVTIDKEVEIPSSLPDGDYNVIAQLNDQDDEEVLCLEGVFQASHFAHSSDESDSSIRVFHYED